jgi:oligopeptide transport system permease protein
VKRFMRSAAGIAGIAVLVVAALAAFCGPMISPHTYHGTGKVAFEKPSLSHPMGTDELGRDVFVRTMHGLRISLMIGLLATAVSVLIGVCYGCAAGYAGGKIDGFMMRVVDVIYGLPYMMVVIVLMAAIGRNVLILFIALGAVQWLTMARIVRGQVLSLKEKEFIEAARSYGAGPLRIVLRHIIPNLAGTVIVYATLMVPQVILEESFLSFLGLGVQAPRCSLGSLTSTGWKSVESALWAFGFPAGVLIVVLLSLSFIGDALRDAFDPKAG